MKTTWAVQNIWPCIQGTLNDLGMYMWVCDDNNERCHEFEEGTGGESLQNDGNDVYTVLMYDILKMKN